MKWYKIYYMMVDFNIGILLVYLPVLLRMSVGFNEIQIGQLYLWGGFVAIIGSLLNGYIAQRISDERRVVQVGSILLLLGIIGLYRYHSFQITLLIFVLLFLMRTTIYVIGDELIINYLNANPQLNSDFGKIRSFGSLGWGLNFLINGILVTINPNLLVISWLIAASVLLISSIKMPRVNVKHDVTSFELKQVKSLFNNRNFMLFIIGNGLFWGTINNMQTYSQFLVLDLGGSLTIYGIFNSLILIVDFIVMNKSPLVNKYLGDKKYYRLITCLILAKYVIIALAFDPLLIYISILIDPFFFGLMIPFSSKYIKNIIDPNLSTIALSLEKVMAQSAAAIGSIIFGYIYSYYSGNIVFVIMSLCTIIIFIISYFIDFSNE